MTATAHPSLDHRARTVIACTLVAAGLAGTAVDNNGMVGLVLFIAGTFATVYLVGRAIRSDVRGLVRRSSWRLPAALAITGTVSLLVANIFKDQDPGAGGVLNQVAYVGMVASAALLAATLVVMVARAAGRPG